MMDYQELSWLVAQKDFTTGNPKEPPYHQQISLAAFPDAPA
jgi:hypothetical protein